MFLNWFFEKKENDIDKAFLIWYILNMKQLDEVIAEMYPTMKKYLPRLSSFLMGMYAADHKMACQKIHHQYISIILFSFCNFLKYQEALTEAYNYAYENLSNEDFKNKPYLKFVDGKLYDKMYDEFYFYTLIESAEISYESQIKSLKPVLKKNMDTLIDYLDKVTSYVINETDINGELTCAEYIEQCFIHSLANTLELYTDYENSINDK